MQSGSCGSREVEGSKEITLPPPLPVAEDETNKETSGLSALRR